MKKIIILFITILVLSACQSEQDETETVDTPDNLDDVLVDFQNGNPMDVEEYLGAWVTYEGEERPYEILQIKEEDGEFVIHYDEVGEHGRLLQTLFGEMDELSNGYGFFDYGSDEFGNTGSLEVHLEEDGLLLVQEIQMENRDDSSTREIFFDRKMERD
ncbi:membrane lipoprotein lipid attachment site-containing protein [Alkalibacillus silvisoli]|uniref:Lipocalin-like domain-containing protein n=1 Tax=Alkalibacillus silvisoli TaxID=392823 RepID=A0ABN0ZP58_9BACI